MRLLAARDSLAAALLRTRWQPAPRLPMHALPAAAGRSLPRRLRSRGAPRRGRRRSEGAALRVSRSPRPASTRRRSPTSTRAPSPPTSSRRRYELRLPGAAGASCGRNTAAAMPEVSDRLHAPARSASSPASTSPTTRRSRAEPRELTAADYVYSHQAPLRPALEEPATLFLLRGRQASLGLTRAAQAGARRQASPSTTTREVEGLRALDRYTLQFRLARAAPALHLHAAPTARSSARWRARWSSTTATASMEHPVGTGPFRLARVEAQLAHRARAQPELPRAALRRASRRPTTPQAQAHRRRACKGRRLPMVDRVEVVDHRGERSRAGWPS